MGLSDWEQGGDDLTGVAASCRRCGMIVPDPAPETVVSSLRCTGCATRINRAGTVIIPVDLPSFQKIIDASAHGKIQAIKELRAATYLGLKEAKDVIDRMWSLSTDTSDGDEPNVMRDALIKALDEQSLLPDSGLTTTTHPETGKVETHDMLSLLAKLVEQQAETNALLRDLMEALSE